MLFPPKAILTYIGVDLVDSTCLPAVPTPSSNTRSQLYHSFHGSIERMCLFTSYREGDFHVAMAAPSHPTLDTYIPTHTNRYLEILHSLV